MDPSEPSALHKLQSHVSTAISSPVLPMILGMVTIGLWVSVFATTSTMISEEQKRNYWPSIRGQVVKVVSSTMVGMFILLVTSIIYFLQDQTKSIYVIFVLIALASGLSYSALAAAAVT